MPYVVELNRFTKRSRLVYVATVRRNRIGKKGTFNRSIMTMNGRPYHVTKGYRTP